MEEIFQRTKSFIETSSSCNQAMNVLKNGAKIGLVLEPNFPCCIVKHKSTYSLEKTSSADGDIVLRVHPDALNRILHVNPESLSDLGIETLKEILLKRIDLQVNASIKDLIRKGYFKLPLSAGAPFLSYLASLGLNRMSKVYHWIEVLRKRER